MNKLIVVLLISIVFKLVEIEAQKTGKSYAYRNTDNTLVNGNTDSGKSISYPLIEANITINKILPRHGTSTLYYFDID